ncbi:MAG TPA: DMT family transporter [Thermoanaerobaculia bacterium]|nr:DMT family transporter [Thermoanaerobaculia bacterium]
MSVDRRRLLSEAGLLAITAVWGWTFVVVHEAVALLAPLPFLASRFLIAAALVAAVFWRQTLALGLGGLKAGLAMGAALTAGYVFQTSGLTLTSAANAGFITGMVVVFTPFLGALFLRQKVTAQAWVLAGVAALGMYLLSGVEGKWNPGDLLVLGCALSFAAHILITDRVVQRHHPGALVVVQVAFCGLACLGGSLALGQWRLPPTPQVWWAIGITAVLASALGFFVQTTAQRYTTPARTALIITAEPVFAGLAAYFLAGERFTARRLLGAALILTAILWAELSRLRAEQSEPDPAPP